MALPRRTRACPTTASCRCGAAPPGRRPAAGPCLATTSPPPSTCSSAPPPSYLRAEIDAPLELSVVDALAGGAKPAEAVRRTGSTAERAATAGDRLAELSPPPRRALSTACSSSPRVGAATGPAPRAKLCRCSRSPGDDLALCHLAYQAPAYSRSPARPGRCADRSARKVPCALLADWGSPHYDPLGGCSLTRASTASSSVSEMLTWLDAHEASGQPPSRGPRLCRAGRLPMLGCFDEARALIADVRAEQRERGGGNLMRSLSLRSPLGQHVELLARRSRAGSPLGPGVVPSTRGPRPPDFGDYAAGIARRPLLRSGPTGGSRGRGRASGRARRVRRSVSPITGGRCGRRCSRGAASTPGGTARRARRSTYPCDGHAQRAGRRVRRSRRGADLRGSPEAAARPWSRRSTVRAEGERRHGRARSRTARGTATVRNGRGRALSRRRSKARFSTARKVEQCLGRPPLKAWPGLAK